MIRCFTCQVNSASAKFFNNTAPHWLMANHILLARQLGEALYVLKKFVDFRFWSGWRSFEAGINKTWSSHMATDRFLPLRKFKLAFQSVFEGSQPDVISQEFCLNLLAVANWMKPARLPELREVALSISTLTNR